MADVRVLDRSDAGGVAAVEAGATPGDGGSDIVDDAGHLTDADTVEPGALRGALYVTGFRGSPTADASYNFDGGFQRSEADCPVVTVGNCEQTVACPLTGPRKAVSAGELTVEAGTTTLARLQPTGTSRYAPVPIILPQSVSALTFRAAGAEIAAFEAIIERQPSWPDATLAAAATNAPAVVLPRHTDLRLVLAEPYLGIYIVNLGPRDGSALAAAPRSSRLRCTTTAATSELTVPAALLDPLPPSDYRADVIYLRGTVLDVNGAKIEVGVATSSRVETTVTLR